MLATYAELQAEIADTLHRDDLTAKIPSFIALFERRANRHLNHPQQETTATALLLSGSSSVAYPVDVLEIESVVIDDNGIRTPLTAVPGLQIDTASTVSAMPSCYTVSGGSFVFDSVADKNYTINVRYVSKFSLETTLTNWLLDNHPDLYLYGSLAASAPYIGEDDRIALWAQLATDAISEIKHQGAILRKTPLQTELTNSNTYDIARGY